MEQECKNIIGKHRIGIAEIHEINWKGNGVLGAGNFILMYSGNESSILEQVL
jgi:hypothetical protein